MMFYSWTQIKMHLGSVSARVACLANALNARMCNVCRGDKDRTRLPISRGAESTEFCSSWFTMRTHFPPQSSPCLSCQCNVKGLCMEERSSLANVVSETDTAFTLWTFLSALPGVILVFYRVQIQSLTASSFSRCLVDFNAGSLFGRTHISQTRFYRCISNATHSFIEAVR